MACNKSTLILISSYADGELTAEEATRAESHLHTCEECRKRLEEWRGQREVFEWAYTQTVRDEPAYEWKAEPTASRPTPAIRLSWKPIWTRRGMAWAGAMALALFLCIGYRHAVPPSLPVGRQVAAKSETRHARLGLGVRLELGPHSEVERLDSRSIRLRRGWVSATVNHGQGLRILTQRLDVTDKGTRFVVGTGPKMDYVIVEDGLVAARAAGGTLHQVGAGRVLFARDKGAPVIARLPQAEDDQFGRVWPLVDEEEAFFPRNAISLDWDEGIRRLGQSLEGLQVRDGCVGGWSTDGWWLYDAVICGISKGLRDHFTDIAQAMAGGTVDGGDWEIPVAIIQVSGIESEPQLPADVYYLRVVPKGGTVVWRLTGSMGGAADFPLVARRTDLHGSSFSETSSKSFRRIVTHRILKSGKREEECLMLLTDWPGEYKPSLLVKLSTHLNPPSSDDQELLDAIEELGMTASPLDIRYLDPERSRRVLVGWSKSAGKEIGRAYQQAQSGRRARAQVGAFGTDAPIDAPDLAPGAYRLYLVFPGGRAKPYFEIESGATKRLEASGPDGHLRAESGILPNYDDTELMNMSLQYGVTKAVDGAFNIRLAVIGRPGDPKWRKISDGRGGYTQLRPTEVWTQGWVRIKKP